MIEVGTLVEQPGLVLAADQWRLVTGANRQMSVGTSFSPTTASTSTLRPIDLPEWTPRD